MPALRPTPPLASTVRTVLVRALALPLLAVLLVGPLFAPPAATAQYAVTFGAEGDDYGQSVAVDAAGNTYVTGYANGAVDFDPGPGTAPAANCSQRDDVFLASYDPSGALRFANVLCGDRFGVGEDVAVDAAGNSYVTGYFSGSVDFDPGPGTEIRTPPGTGDNDEIFVASYEPDGDFRSVFTFGGPGYDNGYGIAVDAAGNLYVSGIFDATTDFDPGPGVEARTIVQDRDAFVASYEPDGTLRYVFTFGTSGSGSATAFDVAVDGMGRAYATGFFRGAVDFDPGPGVEMHTSADAFDGVVVSLDPSGALRFVRTIGPVGRGIAVDGAGNSYAVGEFENTEDFDPTSGAGARTSNGRADAFVVGFDPDGALHFLETIGGSGSDGAASVALDAAGHLHVAGRFWDTVDFDPGPGTALRTSDESSDAFAASYDATGAFRFVDTIVGTNSARAAGIAVDGAGRRYLTGDFAGTLRVDLGAGAEAYPSSGGRDAFVVGLPAGSIAPPPCDADLRITGFDADGQPAGEFVEVTNAGGDEAALARCSFLVFDPFTEAVVYADGLGPATLAAGAALRIEPPAGTLPDGPGAFGVFDGTGVAVGTDVKDVLGAQVAAVVYFDEDDIVGRFPSASKAGGDFAAALRAAAVRAAAVPSAFVLEGNYPNPFGSRTTIRYRLAEASPVRLTIFDALGRAVRVLVAAPQEAGRHEATWDGRDASGQPVAAGVYLYTLRTGSRTASKAMLLAR